MDPHKVTLFGHVGHDPEPQSAHMMNLIDQAEESRENDIQLINFLVAIHQIKVEEICFGEQ